MFFTQQAGDESLQRKIVSSSRKSLDLRKILTDVATAVFDLHTNGLAHLDIKPCNIVYVGTENTYKLIDFGSFRQLDSDGSVCLLGHCVLGHCVPQTPSLGHFTLNHID